MLQFHHREKIKINGLTFKQYLQRTIEDSEKIIPEDVSEIIKSRHSILKLNIHRMNRVGKTYNISDELITELINIKEKQLWMVISEPWCGDSAQIVPQLAKMAEINPMIELKILLRDENPDIMDLYLTEDNKRSIPVLVTFDEQGEELLKWGSRPASAEKLVSELKEQGFSKDEYLAKLHLWYAHNKGIEVERELISLFKNTVAV
jgi:hypothetical protein